MGLAKGKALPTRNDLFLFTLKLLTRMSQQEIISVYNREFDATAIPGDARNRWGEQSLQTRSPGVSTESAAANQLLAPPPSPPHLASPATADLHQRVSSSAMFDPHVQSAMEATQTPFAVHQQIPDPAFWHDTTHSSWSSHPMVPAMYQTTIAPDESYPSTYQLI
ncbi:hypothetical protein D8B26_001295 [Coccidioides posadasii str. Silveira]|uniref:uncharacterized protein n=1 Tax=Coccidioides posadasii (strain RMSCC 757 / Silveira) TaxID=443226 RepID=UPI001BEF803D|nr:hypothetical protein D8B26_001295 [Coccidioides posadasii str. Silveira]